MGDLILSEDHGAVRVLTLNSPKTLNALSEAMLAELDAAFDRLEAESATCRVVILRGSGKGFCAGHHLAELSDARARDDKGAAYLTALFETCSALMQRIHRLPQPLIAQVHGIATAAGCQLVATCDLAVAAETTRFGVYGVIIVLFCSTPMVALSRNIARKQAFEMLTTGGFIHADAAVEVGLANRSVPDDQLETETIALARTIAEKLGSAVRIGKRAFYEQLQMPLDQAYAYTGRVMVENMADDDTAEGLRAFLEKRDPDWAQD